MVDHNCFPRPSLYLGFKQYLDYCDHRCVVICYMILVKTFPVVQLYGLGGELPGVFQGLMVPKFEFRVVI